MFKKKKKYADQLLKWLKTKNNEPYQLVSSWKTTVFELVANPHNNNVLMCCYVFVSADLVFKGLYAGYS